VVGVGRRELTDRAWTQIAPLLPVNKGRCGRWADHRRVVNGILWKLRTGSPWWDLPERYGPWQTCYDRLLRWRRDGTWDRLLAHTQTRNDAVGEVEWVVSVDSSVIRAHQHAAGARHRRTRAERHHQTGVGEQDEALGRSRGGLSTKLHLAVDGKGRPLAVLVTAGQRHESTQLRALLDGICVPRPGGVGRLASGPTGCWPTEATRTRPAAGCYAGAGSPTPSQPDPTSGVDLGGRSGSTPTATDSATSWSGA